MMKVKDLIKALKKVDPNLDVVVPTANASLGPHSITHVNVGFDWDHGKLFLTVEPAVVKASSVSRESLLVKSNEKADYLNQHDMLPKSRKHCYSDGWYEGALFGITLLKEENKL